MAKTKTDPKKESLCSLPSVAATFVAISRGDVGTGAEAVWVSSRTVVVSTLEELLGCEDKLPTVGTICKVDMEAFLLAIWVCGCIHGMDGRSAKV